MQQKSRGRDRGKRQGEEERKRVGVGDVAISFGELRVLNFMLIMFTT